VAIDTLLDRPAKYRWLEFIDVSPPLFCLPFLKELYYYYFIINEICRNSKTLMLKPLLTASKEQFVQCATMVSPYIYYMSLFIEKIF